MWKNTTVGFTYLGVGLLILVAAALAILGLSKYAEIIGPAKIQVYIAQNMVWEVTAALLLLGAVLVSLFKRWFGWLQLLLTLLLLLALYCAAFGTYNLESNFVFHFHSNAKLWNILLWYPLAGAATAYVMGYVFLGLYMLFVYGAQKVEANGPTVPPIAIVYGALAVLAALGAGQIQKYSKQILGVSEESGRITLMIVVGLFVILILAPNLRGIVSFRFKSGSAFARRAAAFVYAVRCTLSVFDALLADGLGLVGAIPNSALRYLAITLTYIVPCLIVWLVPSDLPIPWTTIRTSFDWMAWILIAPFLMTLAIYRRTAWQDEYRQENMITTRVETRTAFDKRPNLEEDLNDELLYCVLLMSVVVIPTALCVLSQHYPLFSYAANFSPNILDWAAFLGIELIRDFPFLDDLRALAHVDNTSRFTPTELGQAVVFCVRVLVDVSILAILFQSFRRSSSDARQREQFEDVRSPVDRLDPIEERELFRQAEKDWQLVTHLPTYNDHRLEAVVSRINSGLHDRDLPEVVGAARIAGFQLNGGAISKLLFSRLERSRRDDSVYKIRVAFTDRWAFGDLPTNRTEGRKSEVAHALLAGLQKKIAELEEFAPDTALVQAALLAMDGTNVHPKSEELSSQIEAIARAGRIETLLRDLQSDDDSRSYAAGQELTTFVNAADAALYRSMLKSAKRRVVNIGMALLSMLPPDEVNEAAILSYSEESYWPSDEKFDALSRIGGQMTFDYLSKSAAFNNEERFLGFEEFDQYAYSFSADRTCAALVSIALRVEPLKSAISEFFKTQTAALCSAGVRQLSVKALRFLYEPSLDGLLLDCAWRGFSGEDERPRSQTRREDRWQGAFHVQIEALQALSLSKSPLIVESLEKLLGKYRKDERDSGAKLLHRLWDILRGRWRRTRIMGAITKTIDAIKANA